MQGFNLPVIVSILLLYIWLKNDIWYNDFEVKLSVMVLYDDGNDQILVTWLLGVILDAELCEKKWEILNSEAWKILENKESFVIKLVIIGPLENYDFWYRYCSVLAFTGLLNCLNWRYMKNVMAVLLELRRLDQNGHTYVLVLF